MKKNGFTLVELLAVIVILGILVSVVSISVLGAKKGANLEEAKKLEEEIESLGADVYMDSKEVGNYDATYLEKYGLVLVTDKNNTSLLGIKNPNGSDDICVGYLEITSDIEFVGHICCPNLYKTGTETKPTSCDNFVPANARTGDTTD